MSTDAGRFPHHWPEASVELGIPDVPEIHLAIRTLSDRLMTLHEKEVEGVDMAPKTAMRCASRAVLESESIEVVSCRFLTSLGYDLSSERIEQAMQSPKTYWLRMARDSIAADGIDPGPDASRLATRYGWRSA